ncbi:hypothetical protein LCGC14_2195220 [marine sediment metagenome]|uniref:Uncharacterized protein n=1 Tax=marine sediment metagenome TaxID=412755 RepID=A0A0F9GE53_9ZZZZ
MSGPAPTKRTLMMVEAYQAGGSLRLVAWIFGCSKNRVNLAVKRHAPEAMRAPHVNHPMEPRYA